MTMTIATQTEELVNYQNVLAITQAEGTVDDDNGGIRNAYAVIATLVNGEDMQLGVYDTDVDCGNAYENLKKWLKAGVNSMFEMPIPEGN